MSKRKESKSKMLDKETLGNMSGNDTNLYHGENVTEIMWADIKTWDEAYENYVRWYVSRYTKLGKALK